MGNTEAKSSIAGGAKGGKPNNNKQPITIEYSKDDNSEPAQKNEEQKEAVQI